MRLSIFYIVSFISITAFAQITYGTPADELPMALMDMERLIDVNHFPATVDPIQQDDVYYWKHSTSILCKSSPIKITEFGAYLFYNDTWNLRKRYSSKDFDDFFNTEKQLMKQGEPYTWPDNWRFDKQVYAGWSLWYFIGITTDGTTICGYQKIKTTENLLNP